MNKINENNGKNFSYFLLQKSNKYSINTIFYSKFATKSCSIVPTNLHLDTRIYKAARHIKESLNSFHRTIGGFEHDEGK